MTFRLFQECMGCETGDCVQCLLDEVKPNKESDMQDVHGKRVSTPIWKTEGGSPELDLEPASNYKVPPPGEEVDVMSYNVGDSDYAEHDIQPWDIWEAYSPINPWDADIIKRTLRIKASQSRRLDYEKIIHICQKRISQIDRGVKV